MSLNGVTLVLCQLYEQHYFDYSAIMWQMDALHSKRKANWAPYIVWYIAKHTGSQARTSPSTLFGLYSILPYVLRLWIYWFFYLECAIMCYSPDAPFSSQFGLVGSETIRILSSSKIILIKLQSKHVFRRYATIDELKYILR